MSPIYKDKLKINLLLDRSGIGIAAALDVSNKIQELLTVKKEINMVFAAAPSQNELLNRLVSNQDIDWSRVNAFHMDEYIGLNMEDPQSFGYYLKERIFGVVNFKSVHYINGRAKDLEVECHRYARLLSNFPIDIACLGIGENGHLAFNDPHTADFKDGKAVKIVTLDADCKMQQVNDGCFPDMASVPEQAITVTIPTLLSSLYMFCVVPGKTKAKAVKKTLFSEITEEWPSTILRNKEHAILYLDAKSGAGIKINTNNAFEPDPI
ncbi:6-phosphogluconolactonase [Galbibacter pacificus]|uniref:6-phosphogluconolactonase n=1 Tax=Galbibacter pacificus TaxID=2996052 RepID=A0ABT6FN18_9FLAO|nr:6-phosphogluconolactonase [Galbibacter pacificus]MDG3581175.1 6-phosphogluconolactonase [Galbibacter pacificus]MDG3584653.1 6-phosphogluconolactonase [Galbibacter pacificus]